MREISCDLPTGVNVQLYVNIEMRCGVRVRKAKVRVLPSPVGSTHFSERSTPIVGKVQAVEKGQEGLC